MKINPCKACGSPWHTKMNCPTIPRPTLVTRAGLKKVGKQGKRTQAAVAAWKRTQKPNHQGYYECYICGKWIPYLMAEHVKGKARHPEDRTNQDNLMPTCDECNERKGSKELSELRVVEV